MKIARQFEKGNSGKPSRKDVKKVSVHSPCTMDSVKVNCFHAPCLKFQGV